MNQFFKKISENQKLIKKNKDGFEFPLFPIDLIMNLITTPIGSFSLLLTCIHP